MSFYNYSKDLLFKLSSMPPKEIVKRTLRTPGLAADIASARARRLWNDPNVPVSEALEALRQSERLQRGSIRSRLAALRKMSSAPGPEISKAALKALELAFRRNVIRTLNKRLLAERPGRFPRK